MGGETSRGRRGGAHSRDNNNFNKFSKNDGNHSRDKKNNENEHHNRIDNRKQNHDENTEQNSQGSRQENKNSNDKFKGGRGGFNNGRGRGRGGFRPQNNNKKSETGEKEEYIPPTPTEDETEIFASGITSGTNFDKFNDIPINISGEDVPASITDFETSKLSDFVLENIKKSGYKTPTPIQKSAIPIIMAGRDLMACAQTGSGKTAAFLLPIISNLLKENKDFTVGRPHVVIMTPTRELGIQIFNETRKFAMKSYLKVVIVYGGASADYQMENIEKGCHILIATPGRLLDFVDKGKISFEDVKVVVLDEADRMLNLGFLSSIEKMMNHSTMPAIDKRHNLMFSATFPEEIQRMAGQFLSKYIFIAVGIVGGACSDVEQKFYEITKFDKRKKLMEILESADPKGTMIFVEMKRNADFLATLLSETKIPTTSIHGDRLQREREEALRDFKSGKMKLLIATSVAARGLDIKNVEHVINYDLPSSIDEYVHRIGRTGRVGNSGKATSFYDPEEDMGIAADLKKILIQANQTVPEFLQNPIIPSNTNNSGKGDFGGKDVRKGMKHHSNKKEQVPVPQATEPEEEW